MESGCCHVRLFLCGCVYVAFRRCFIPPSPCVLTVTLHTDCRSLCCWIFSTFCFVTLRYLRNRFYVDFHTKTWQPGRVKVSVCVQERARAFVSLLFLSTLCTDCCVENVHDVTLNSRRCCLQTGTHAEHGLAVSDRLTANMLTASYRNSVSSNGRVTEHELIIG